jgi:hypothetical protein
MKHENNFSTKHWELHVLIMIASLFAVYLIGLYARYFLANKVLAQVPVWGSLSIDIIGAVVPVVVGVFSTIIFFCCLKTSWKKYLAFFSFSFFLNYLTGIISPSGFLIKPLENVLVVSLIVVLPVLGKNPLLETSKKFVTSFVIVLSVIPLTLFLSDFFTVPFFVGPTIGGDGLADGILVSTMYAPFAAGIIASFYVFIREVYSSLKRRLSQ